MRRPRIRATTVVLLVLLGGIFWLGWFGSPMGRARIEAALRLPLPRQRVDDRIGMLSRWDASVVDGAMRQAWEESGIDMRLLIVRDLGGRSIEEFAVEEAARLALGRKDGHARGLLVVYDAQSDRLRIEVGYGLEAYLPDAFIGFVLEENLHDYVALEDMRRGMNATVVLLQHRLREASLGGDFDPAPIEFARSGGFPTGGAGASAGASTGGEVRFIAATRRDAARRFTPQPTVEETHRVYHEWLAAPHYYPDAAIFTPESQTWNSHYPMPRGLRTYEILLEHGKRYRIIEQGDVAVQYFLDTPLASPNFYRRTRAGWQLDVVGAHRNVLAPLSGLPWSWGMIHSGDEYGRAFQHLYVKVDEDGPWRFRDGDNRPVRTRVD